MSSTMSSTETVPSRAFASLIKRPSTSNGWPDPQLSIGLFIKKIGKHMMWEAIGPARAAFEKMAPDIKSFVEGSNERRSRSVIWSTYMIGKAVSSASPTIVFFCEVLEHRQNIRRAVRDSDILRGYPGFKTGHQPRPPHFAQLVNLGYGEMPTGIDHHVLTALSGTSKNVCGMRLLVSTSGTCWDKEATISGVITVDTKYFYITAGHPFMPAISRNAEIEEDSDSFSIDSSVDGHPEASEVSSNTSAELEDQETTLQHIDQPGPHASHTSEFRSNPYHGILPRLGLRDEAYFGNLRVAHISSESSSLDYALIEVDEASHETSNFFFNDATSRNILCNRVASFGSSECPVWALTRRGAIDGTLGMTPSYMITPGSTTGCEIRIAKFGKPLEVGDSGSWVVHERSGDVYGHIVAGSPRKGMAVVVSLSAIFEDVKAVMGYLPTFPFASDESNESAEDHKGKRLEVDPIGALRNVSLLASRLMAASEPSRAQIQILTPSFPSTEKPLHASTLFLTGPTDVPWRKELIQLLEQQLTDNPVSLTAESITIFDPVQDTWDSTWKARQSALEFQTVNTRFREQRAWEVNHQEAATLIVIFFDKRVLTEFDVHRLASILKSGKAVIGCHTGFCQQADVEYLCSEFEVPLEDTIVGLAERVLAELEGRTKCAV